MASCQSFTPARIHDVIMQVGHPFVMNGRKWEQIDNVRDRLMCIGFVVVIESASTLPRWPTTPWSF